MKQNMRTLADISIWTGQTLVASILVSSALALVAIGCGEQKQKATAEVSTPDAPVATAHEAAPNPGGQAVAASATGTPEIGQVEALPPDVAATAPDTLVQAGSVVTITALGSADVTSVTLADGLGEKTPFTYDSESNLWRVSYRIPVRIREDRIGLSVTATTDANRYKKIWVFLKTRESAEKPATTAEDSGQ